MTCTNNRVFDHGSLQISKTVVGVATQASMNREFVFFVTFSGEALPDTFYYTGSRSGSIQNGGYVLLRHGETVVFENLPVGTSYIVEELPVPEYYITYANGDVGTITDAGMTACADFINTFTKNPRTGDNTPLALMAVGCASGLAVVILMILRKRRENG